MTAQIGDLHAALDGPCQPLDEGCTLALEILVQDPDRYEIDVGRDVQDDARARRPVAVQVGGLVRHHLRLTLPVDADRHALHQPVADPRVAALHAAVDDGDGDSLAGGPAPGPRPVDPAQPGSSRQAIGRRNGSAQAGSSSGSTDIAISGGGNGIDGWLNEAASAAGSQ